MTKIEWADKSWNPVTGCTKVSPGCKNCYAERMARRLAGRCGYPEAPHHFNVTLHPDRLEQPLRWHKPRRIFVCSMGDLFHEDVPSWFLDDVFSQMFVCNQHTFQILTKRPMRMLRYWKTKSYSPSSNVWLGVSVENQATADERIPILLRILATVRFVSLEPLLGPVDISPYMLHPSRKSLDFNKMPGKGDGFTYPFTGLDWVIVGGESGPGARPMKPDWARNIRDQCQTAGVPFFFKQWGACMPYEGAGASVRWADGVTMLRVGKKAAGRLLDGKLHEEYPR